MPYGFMGSAAEKYLSNVSSSISAAGSANKSGRSAVKMQHSPESAKSGGFPTGVGNKGNIVVSQATYDEVMRKIRMVDEAAAQDLYNIAVKIEEMCSSIYVVPSTLPKYLSVLDQVKSSLGEFQSLTEETVIHTRRYVDQIMSIG